MAVESWFRLTRGARCSQLSIVVLAQAAKIELCQIRVLSNCFVFLFCFVFFYVKLLRVTDILLVLEAPVYKSGCGSVSKPHKKN